MRSMSRERAFGGWWLAHGTFRISKVDRLAPHSQEAPPYLARTIFLFAAPERLRCIITCTRGTLEMAVLEVPIGARNDGAGRREPMDHFVPRENIKAFTSRLKSELHPRVRSHM